MVAQRQIIDGFTASWRFLAPAWRGAWAAIGLSATLVAFWLTLSAEAPQSPWRPVSLISTLAVLLVAQGGLLKIALHRGEPGLGGLSVSRAHIRLLIVWLLTGVLMAILLLLALVVAFSVAYGVASAGVGFVAGEPLTWPHAVDDRGRVVLGGVALLGVVGLAWAWARVSFAPAATIDLGRVQVLSTWPMTRTLAWQIIAGNLAIGVAPAAVVVVLDVAHRAFLSGYGAAGWIGNGAVGLAIAGLWLPMNVALMTYFYRRTPAEPSSPGLR